MPSLISEFKGPYSFLSNFYRCKIMSEGVSYPTLEHAFQACKYQRKFDREMVAAARSPAVAKALGRQAILPPDWDSCRVRIMRDLIRKKFCQNEDLCGMLLSTGDAILEEGNHWGDCFWGKVDGQGENWLGRILMDLRKELVNRENVS